MPTCFVTLSESVADLSDEQIGTVRDIVAEELDSRSRRLDRGHIVIRVQRSRRAHMLGDVELEIFAQLFWRRFFSRDRRAQAISRRMTTVVSASCATWINMSIVGYARVTPTGETFFSD